MELYPKTGILILLNLPKNLRIGLDNTSFQISEKFKGFKLIPPGCHYLHYTERLTEGEFFWIEEGQVIVKEWVNDMIDPNSGKIGGNGAQSTFSWAPCGDKEKVERFTMAAKNMEMDAFLAAYQYQQADMWKELTFYITKPLLKRMKISLQKVKDAQQGAEYKNQNPEEESQELQEKITNFDSNLDNKYKNSKIKPLTKEEFDSRLKELLSAGDKLGASKFVENFETAEYT